MLYNDKSESLAIAVQLGKRIAAEIEAGFQAFRASERGDEDTVRAMAAAGNETAIDIIAGLDKTRADEADRCTTGE